MIMTKPTHIDSRVKQSHTETNEFSAFQSQMSHLIPTLHLYSMNVTDNSKENKYEYTVTDNYITVYLYLLGISFSSLSCVTFLSDFNHKSDFFLSCGHKHESMQWDDSVALCLLNM